MRKTIFTLFLTVILTVFSVFLSLNHATNSDEAAHIVGGLSIWKYGRFDLYHVNPPLVRMIAALPVTLFCEPDIDWTTYRHSPDKNDAALRPEFGMGLDFVRRNAENLRRYLFISRLACFPFCLLGAYYVRRWANELYGEWAGLTALALWCFSPNILTWGSFVIPDLPAASLGITACYYFWRWLQIPDKGNTFIAGLTFGLTLLTKLTWIILFPLFPLLCLIWYLFKAKKRSWKSAKNYVFQMILLLMIAVVVLNFGYGFEGTFTKLGDYRFSSHALTAHDSEYWHTGNRFAKTPLKYLPIPFPSNFIQGIDTQRLDFERGLPSYLNGQWSEHGWWYFYLECLFLKVPPGTLCLGLLTIFFLLTKIQLKETRANFCDELTLFIPALTLFLFVSSQTGFSVHFRYVLPAFPFAFVAVSKVFAIAKERSVYWRIPVFTLLLWSIGSSLSVFPYSMSYFNELTGGSTKGFYYLHGSSIDWGQDALRLKKWLFKHPEIKGLHLTLSTDIAAALFIPENYPIVPTSPGISINSNESEEDNDARQLAPRPGWFAISVTQLHARHGRYRYFLDLKPKYRIGYSINIYHITLDEANDLRKKYGLPKIILPSYDLEKSLEQITKNRQNHSIQRVAIYGAAPIDENTVNDLQRILDSEPLFHWKYLTAKQICAGDLSKFDVVIFPGGKASEQSQDLGTQGKTAIRDFVQNGGSYLGICAGAFLATTLDKIGLGIINVRPISGSRYSSGFGYVSQSGRGGHDDIHLQLTTIGSRFFNEPNSTIWSSIYYSSGPVFESAYREDLPNYSVLATFKTETWLYPFQKETMIHKPAIVYAPYGKGRVFLVSPHLEMSHQKYDAVFKRMIHALGMVEIETR